MIDDMKAHDDSVIAFYNGQATRALNDSSGMQDAHPFIHYLIEELPKAAKVLECGAGPGRNALELAEAGLEVTAWDVSPKCVELVRLLAAKKGLIIQAEQKDMRHGLNEDYEAVVALFVLHHLLPAEVQTFVADIKAHTRPRGFNLMQVYLREGIDFKGSPIVAAEHRFHPEHEKELDVMYQDWENYASYLATPYEAGVYIYSALYRKPA